MLSLKVWDNTELVPHEESNKVYLKLNFKLHIYFAVQKINHELEPVADCLQQVKYTFQETLNKTCHKNHFHILQFQLIAPGAAILRHGGQQPQ